MLKHYQKKVMIIVCLFTLPMAFMYKVAYAQQDAVIADSNKSAFKGALYSVWNRLRSFNPRTNTADATGYQVSGKVCQRKWLNTKH